MTEEENLLRQIFGESTEDFVPAVMTPVVHPDMPDRLTVGRLRERLEGLSDDAPVYYHRIEDSYFTPGTGWGEHAVKLNEANMRDESCHGDYIRAWDSFQRKDDDALYITAHY